MTTVHHLYFITFTILILSTQSNSNNTPLLPTDHKALISLHTNLGISIHNTAGIFYEHRIFNTTTVLRVTRITLNHRRLKGSISPSIGKLTELKELSLPNNHLINQIPASITSCRKLETINLRNNRLSGQVPVELSSLVRLKVLDLAGNKFSGDLSFLKWFPNLEILSLDNNMFTGKIPASIRSFRNLRVVNFSGNGFLEDPLPVLNRLELVPKRYVFAESNQINNDNNNTGTGTGTGNGTSNNNNNIGTGTGNNNNTTGTGIGNGNVYNIMAPAPAPASAGAGKHKDKKKKVVRWVVGFGAGTVAGIMCGAIISVLFKLVLNMIKGRKNDSGMSIFSQLIKAEELAFLEKDDGVGSLQVIGRGGCGEVYKIELPESKVKTIAIKKVVQPPKDAAELTEEDTKLLNKKMRQIKSEIQTVGQIRHRNLVPLLAHVSRPDCHYLVYEFMKNGSLQDILQQVKDGNRELDWLARHRIALGVAAGLEYLHLSHTPRIVHRDLKPANVLLDNDMEARIADFGLAKSIPDADTHMTSSNVAGTLGYIAPEYHQTLKFTDKCDIYSFGVLLAVLVMGKLPSDEFFQRTSEMSMVKWLRNVMTGEDPKQAIDTKLLGNGYEEQMLLVLKIACFCTLDNPKERPNSKDARLMLAQIIH